MKHWFIAAVLGLLAGVAAAQQVADDPVAIIGSSVITENEVARIASGRPDAYPDLPPEERRPRIRDTLIAEYLIDYHYGRETGLLAQPVLDALNDARRQVLFQFYAQSQFTPPEITEADIAEFARKNPALFKDRRGFRYAQVIVAEGQAAARADMRARAEAALDRPDPDLAALDALAARARDPGLEVRLDTNWAPSEALPGELRDRLDAMVRTDRRLDIRTRDARVSLLALYEAVALPVRPGALRAQIKQRLVAQAYQAHRATLIDRLAAQVLDSGGDGASAADAGDKGNDAAPEITPPPRGTVVWSNQANLPRNVRLVALFGAGLFGALAAFALWTWLRQVLLQYPLIVRRSLSVPIHQWRGTGMVITVIGFLGLSVSLANAVSVALRTLGDGTTLVLLGGGATIAIAMAVTWHIQQRRAVQRAIGEMEQDYTDEAMARDRAILQFGSGRLLIAVVVLLVLYGAALALLLDVPPGLS